MNLKDDIPKIMPQKEREAKLKEELKKADQVVNSVTVQGSAIEPNGIDKVVSNEISSKNKQGDKVLLEPGSQETDTEIKILKDSELSPLPNGVIEAIRDNPLLDNNFVKDLQQLASQQNDIKYCEEPKKVDVKENQGCMPKIVPDDERDKLLSKDITTVDNFLNLGGALADVMSAGGIRETAKMVECSGKITNAVNQIKQENDAIKIETDKLIQYTTAYYTTLLSYSYNLHVSIQHARLYQIQWLHDNINNKLHHIKDRLTYFSQEKYNKNKLYSKIGEAHRFVTLERINGLINEMANMQHPTYTVNWENVSSKINYVSNTLTNNLHHWLNTGKLSTSHTVIYDFVGANRTDSGLIHNLLSIMGREPSEDEAKSGNYMINLANQTEQGIMNLRDDLQTFIVNVRESSRWAYAVMRYQNFHSFQFEMLEEVHNRLLEAIYNLINAYEISDLRTQKENAISKLKNVECFDDQLTDGSLVDQDLPENTTTPNNNHKTYSSDENAGIKTLKYWQLFARQLNLVALLPIHWSIGLIIPAPSGVVRVPLPVIWIPLVVIPTPAMVTVVWLTINGMVVCPTIWQWRFKPIADGDSYHLTLFRGGNRLIKNKTGTELANLGTIVGGLDTNPDITKSAPFIKDDIPVQERLNPTNILYMAYLNQWCSKAKPSMGLP